MSYSLKSVTLRTDNSESGMAKINELWADIMTGKIPLEFIENGVPVKGLSPISSYSDYESDEKGKYNLSVMTVTAAFFAKMEELVAQRKYIKIDESGELLPIAQIKRGRKFGNLPQAAKLNVHLLSITKAQYPPNIPNPAKRIAICT